MIVLKYSQKHHRKIIHAISLSLKHGKIVAYPTDTSYGLAVDPTQPAALKRFYRIKQRTLRQPIHIVVASVAQAKQYGQWNQYAQKLVNQFWPGPLSLVLPLKTSTKIGQASKNPKLQFVKSFSADTGTIGLRCPQNKIALDIVKVLGQPITATSANPSHHGAGSYDSYSAQDVIDQFSKQKHKPDIIIDAGTLPKRKPSTLVKVNSNGSFEILRAGPITKKQITKIFQTP